MQRAETLPAERIGVALGGAGEIHCRDLGEVLGAPERAEHEFDRRSPVAEIVGQRLRARDVALARGIGDGAIGAHPQGEEILDLALARVAPADAHLLALRRRIDLDAAARRELGDRIEVGRMNPMRAAVIGHAESARVGDAAPADMVGRLDQHELAPGGGDFTRGRDTCRTGSDDDHVDAGQGRGDGAERRACRQRGRGRRGGEERAAAQSQHGFQMPVVGRTLPEGRAARKRAGDSRHLVLVVRRRYLCLLPCSTTR